MRVPFEAGGHTPSSAQRGEMSSRRTLIIIAAVAVAAIAAFANVTYLNNVQNRAYQNAKRVWVYRVTQDIPKGTTGDAAIGKFIEKREIPQEFRPGNALTDQSAIKGKIALATLSAGQVLVDGQFVDPIKAQTTTRDRIPVGQIAFTISVDQVHGVGNLLFPGDQVDVFVQDKDKAGQSFQRLLYQNVDILYIGASGAPQPGETQAVTNPSSGVITFAAPVDAAQRIILASQGEGGLYLGLVPRNNKPVPPQSIGHDQLFGGTLTPCGNDKSCGEQ
jgi:pilus assembly protein CpaB